jgi:hypothetical protein
MYWLSPSPSSAWAVHGSRACSQAPDEAWEKISCGDGAKGPRVYHWAAVRIPVVAEFDYQGEVSHRTRWALARRSINKPDEIAYYLAYAPLQVTVQELVRVGGSAGRSRSASRPRRTSAAWISTSSAATWTGIGTSLWPFSLTPSWPLRHTGPGKGGRTGETPGAIGLTVAEVRRLLAACRARPPHLSGHRGRHHAPSWSNWRRRRQAVARHCHYLRRCRTTEGQSP